MIYSNFYLKDKFKIPTFIGIFFILFIVLVFLSFMSNSGAKPSRANKETVERIEITNISPIQATVFWQSGTKETSWILYGEENKEIALQKIALDERDVTEKKGSYLNHSVILRNLYQGKDYYFAIVVSEKLVTQPDGSLFHFKTPSQPASKNKFDPAYGRVIKKNTDPLGNAMVLLSFIDQSIYPLSIITKETGEWLIPLNSFYDKNTGEEKSLTGNEKIKIEIFDEENNKSTLYGYLNKLSSAFSQSIVIGKDYPFAGETQVLSASTSTSTSENNEEKIGIIYPQEGALIPGRTPLIKGVALPKSTVFITINSKKTYSATVTAGEDGQWRYLIPEALELGSHKLTIKTKDEKGQEIVLTRKFTIISNETTEGKVLGLASGEPTIIPTSISTPTEQYNQPSLPPVSPTSPVSGGANFTPMILGSVSFMILGVGILIIF